jgi:phage terminase large subunit-like protein
VGKLTRGNRNIQWIESHCRIPEGKLVGQPVKLTRHQKKWVRSIYDTPTRLFILSIPRKNAKTAISAMLLLLHTCGPEAKPNSQLFSAAQSRDQAGILFALAAKMVRMSPDLSAYVSIRDTAKQLYCEELGTLYRALSAEASTAYGLSPAFVVHDELGQVKGPRSELYDALETASAAQESPLSIVISTQAPTDGDLLSILIDDAKTKADPTIKVEVWSAPDDADPFCEKTVAAANPHYNDFMNRDEVLRQMESARRMPSREASFRNLILNQRIDMNSPFIARSVWESCAGEALEQAFIDGPVYLGLDLSARHDLTAAVAVAQYEKIWYSKSIFFAPAQGIRDRSTRDRAPYDLWAERGHLIATPGASIDYSYVAEWLADFCHQYPVKEIAFDRWRIDVLQAEVSRLNVDLPLLPYGQGFKDMAPALDTLETEMLNHRYIHGNNPVLTWCAANAISVSDPAGNRKLDKSKCSGRIDGLVALAMAMGAASRAESEPDISDFLNAPLIA